MALFPNTLRLSSLATMLVLTLSAALVHAGDTPNSYQETDLVSDQALPNVHQDSNLVNAWGLAFNPNGSPAWVADNGTSFSTLHSGNATKISLEVAIPSQNPTGIVCFGCSAAFLVDGNASRFIFA